MVAALAALREKVASGVAVPAPSDEDVHGALERLLIEAVGPELGGKLRAGRSRNDQIATLPRMYLRRHARVIAGQVLDVVEALLAQADRHIDAPMPGRTHFQHAQPVTLGHHLMAHVWPLLRDVERLTDWDARAAWSPVWGGRVGRIDAWPGPRGRRRGVGLLGPDRELDRRDRLARRDRRVRVGRGHDRH